MPLNQDQILKTWKSRLVWAKGFVLFFFLIIILRLAYLQIYQGDYYALKAENNRIEIEKIPAPRGRIFDRNGILLASNRPCFCLLLYPQKLPREKEKLKKYAQFLKPVLKRPVEEIMDELKQALRCPLSPVYLKKKLKWQEVTYIEAQAYFFPGLKIVSRPLRYYPLHSLAAHILGYVGIITAKQLQSGQFPNADPTDFIGQSGIERAYQSLLAGKKGKCYLEIDALGRILRTLKRIEPIPGNDLYLSIDTALQKEAERSLKGKNGAIVALDPKTGYVLALASSPSFDPNLFVKGMDQKTWQGLLNNPTHPLQNRVTLGLYPPGSIFKIVTALAGLQDKIITPYTRIYCNGGFLLGKRLFRCWKRDGHGWVNLKKAIIESCDVYFYQLGLWLGIERIADYAFKCGFGQKTGIDIQERVGLVPTPAWKWKVYKSQWQKGETLNVAIGQGALLVTPLQIAQFFVALANGGKIYKPQLVLKVVSSEGKVIKESKPLLKGTLPATKQQLRLIKKALTGVMNNPLGTGYNARSLRFEMAGKTGTAQVVSLPQKKSKDISNLCKDHAWFAGFAPVHDPKIVIVVLIEHGGHGGTTAAPIARNLVEFFLSKEQR
jgi:penicillin-binding protein 2